MEDATATLSTAATVAVSAVALADLLRLARWLAGRLAVTGGLRMVSDYHDFKGLPLVLLPGPPSIV